MQINPLKQRASVETNVLSGALHVTVRPSPRPWLLLFEAMLIAAFAASSFRARAGISRLENILSGVVVVGAAVGWFEQLFGFSQVIEFDTKHLRIRTETLGWERTKEYPIEQCTDLQLQNRSGDPHGLQCRIGWRTIEFGNYLSEEQATEVIAALQDVLPEITPKLLPSVDISRHFTKLGLG